MEETYDIVIDIATQLVPNANYVIRPCDIVVKLYEQTKVDTFSDTMIACDITVEDNKVTEVGFFSVPDGNYYVTMSYKLTKV